jgi:hypothetical protein
MPNWAHRSDDVHVENGGVVMDGVMREERLQIMLTPEELSAIDDWRFSRRMPTRAAAVRELLKRGLAAEGFDAALGSDRSQDFGVTASKSDLGSGANGGKGGEASQ